MIKVCPDLRNPERIDPIIDALRAKWKKNPDLRFCQLIYNLLPEGSYAYYAEDNEIESALGLREE